MIFQLDHMDDRFMAAGVHVMICGQHPVSMSINDTYTPGIRFPVMFKYEMELSGIGQERRPNLESPNGDESFPYFELCLETMDFADRTGNGDTYKCQFGRRSGL